MFEVDVAADADDLIAGVTAAVVVIVALADIVFDDNYIFVCVTVDDTVVADLVVFTVVAINDAGVPAVVHVDV